MINFLKLSIIILLFSSASRSSESANLLKKGNREIGIFQPLRWGYSKNIELSAHPILMFIMPNISIKIRHEQYGIASRHGFIYPTPLMRLLQKKGKFGLITSEADVGKVPNVFEFQNEVFKSIRLDRTLVTLKAGFTFAIVSETLDERLSVDLPLIYPGMGEFFNGYKINFGVDGRHYFSEQLSVLLDGDAVIIPTEDIFWDTKLLAEYRLNDHYRILLGTKLTYGNYPFGKQARLFPLFDLIYNWD